MRRPGPDVYAPCRCGSGKKYKWCCLAKDREAASKPGAPSSADGPAGSLLGSDKVIALDLVEGERLNTKGMRLLSRGKYTEARSAFLAAIEAAPLPPAAHNNLALVTFILGDLQEAIRLQERAIDQIPIENVFGMANLVHFYLTAGRESEAESLAEKLTARELRDISALGKTCEVLARLARHTAILAAVEQYYGALDAPVCFFAGIAAANLGRYDRAIAYLNRIERRAAHRARATATIRRIQQGAGPGTIEGNWPYFHAQELFPRSILDRLTGNKKDDSAMRAAMDNAAFVDTLAAILNENGGKDPAALEGLRFVRHPRADELLQTVAKGTFGPDELRLTAVRLLNERGTWPYGEPHKVWLKGSWTMLGGRGFELNPEAGTGPIPERVMPLYEKAVVAGQDGQWKKAERLWRRFLRKLPDNCAGHHNLGVALLQLDREPEAEQHIRKAMELDPAYVFAPCSLAVLLLRRERVAEARELLDAVEVPDELHPDTFACYCAAQVQLAMAEKQIEHAIGWLDMGTAAAPDNGPLAELREMLALPIGLHGFVDQLRERALAKRAKLRRRVLRPDAPLEECYGAYTKERLRGMAQALRLRRTGTLRKQALLETVCERLRRPETVRALLDGLSDEDHAVLHACRQAGGVADYAAFTREHGTDTDDPVMSHAQPRLDPLQHLESLGLLVEATVNHRESVFIPSELQLPPLSLLSRSLP